PDGAIGVTLTECAQREKREEGAERKVLRDTHRYSFHRSGAKGGSMKFIVRRDQSTFAPESLTILAYLGISLRISAANCSGDVGAGSAPCCAKNDFISGVFKMRATSAFHLATISLGVPAGAMKPHQV